MSKSRRHFTPGEKYSIDYCVYGYRKITEELRDMEYEINAKKVYRLMKEHHLLSGKRIQAQGKEEVGEAPSYRR